VAATAAGNFANGVPSSFYQMTESDEGKQFRAIASFTDDTGQVVSATSAPTVPVTDVTPEITIPFTYTVDELSITKNGTQIYDNTFDQAPPASSTILSNGVPTPIVFLTLGSTWTEAGGQAFMSSSGVSPNQAIAGGVEDFALLNTNTDPTSNLGLKFNSNFTVSSIFGLTAPPTGSYGLELNDGTQTHGVDQLVRLIVTRDSGNTVVELVQRDLTANPQTNIILAEQPLTAGQLANNSQIEFQLSHVANSTAITGAFALGNGGMFGPLTTFAPTATIFTHGVDWTRADIGAFTNTGVGLNFGQGQSPREGQTLTASASTNDSDATLHYQWQSSANGGQTWTPIAGAADSASYTVQESDENHNIRVVVSTTDPDNNQTASVTSVVTGPVIDNSSLALTVSVVGNLPVQQGQTLVASATPGDADDASAQVTYQWQSSSDNGQTWTNVPATAAGNFANGMPSSFYQLTESDENNIFRAIASFIDDTGQVVSATSAPTVPVTDVTPEITVPFTYTVDELSITKNGTQVYDNNFDQAPPASRRRYGLPRRLSMAELERQRPDLDQRGRRRKWQVQRGIEFVLSAERGR
jgi:hypothetical protein